MGEIRWTFFPTEDAKCFGCGRDLRKSAHWKQVQKSKSLSGDPHFIFTIGKQKVHICPMCALLCAMKTNGDNNIRQGEFNERTMANINRKHKKEIIARHLAGESYLDMLKEMYPQTKDETEKEIEKENENEQ